MLQFALTLLLLGATIASGKLHDLKRGEYETFFTIGGILPSGQATSNVKINNFLDDTTTDGKEVPCPAGISSFGSFFVDGNIYVVGGCNDTDKTVAGRNVWAYNVCDNKWHTTYSLLPYGVQGNALVELKGKLYSLGGAHMNGTLVTEVLKYHRRKGGEWKALPTPLPAAAANPCAVQRNGDVMYYVALGDLYRSNDGAKTWTKLASMKNKVASASCAFSEQFGREEFFVVGGHIDGVATKSVERYEIGNSVWTSPPALNTAREGSSLTWTGKVGEFLVCGGRNADKDVMDECESYNIHPPNEHKWFVVGYRTDPPRKNFALHNWERSIFDIC